MVAFRKINKPEKTLIKNESVRAKRPDNPVLTFSGSSANEYSGLITPRLVIIITKLINEKIESTDMKKGDLIKGINHHSAIAMRYRGKDKIRPVVILEFRIEEVLIGKVNSHQRVFPSLDING